MQKQTRRADMNILVLIPFAVFGIFILLTLIWFMGYKKGHKDAHELQMLCNKKDKKNKTDKEG